MVKLDKQEWKEKYFTKLKGLMAKYSKVLVVGVDNVSPSCATAIPPSTALRAFVLWHSDVPLPPRQPRDVKHLSLSLWLFCGWLFCGEPKMQ